MSLGSGLGKIVSMNQVDKFREIADGADLENRLANVFDDGVEFRDPYSSRIVKFTPEMSIQTQHKIGADVMMAFDELTNISDSYEYNRKALERTRKWAERSLHEHVRQTNLRAGKNYQALYGCLQGAMFRDLREKAAKDLSEMEIDGQKFDGFGLGGAFAKENLGEIISWMTRILPAEKSRHLLGLSKPDDIFAGVENGCDTFDCVAPTREARHGRIYTLRGDISLKRAEFVNDTRPLDENCDCPTCRENYSRKILREMLKSPDRETRARCFTLLSEHNVRFIIRLMEQIRVAIENQTFTELKNVWLKRYYRV
jgi:queuine tRNA-ribosyltransferase